MSRSMFSVWCAVTDPAPHIPPHRPIPSRVLPGFLTEHTSLLVKVVGLADRWLLLAILGGGWLTGFVHGFFH